jgi:DNA-binding PadR family transcriptional regulator
MAAEPAAQRLPATAWAVLGLLSFGEELSGYDLKQWADHSLRLFYWAPANSQIYSELRRLEASGFVTSRVVNTAETRARRLYRITDDGAEALRAWAATQPGPPVLKHPVMLRVWLGHLAEPAALRSIVEEHRASTLAMAADAATSEARSSTVEGWQYAAVVTAWAERYYRMQAELLDQLIGDLDVLAAADVPTGPAPRPQR